MNNRRRFITLVPFAGASLLAACSKEAAAPSATPAPAPMQAPSPAPATAPTGTSTGSGAATGTGTGSAANSAKLPLLQESEPAAVGLGYVAVASRADTTKFKNYAAGQACGNCALYAGQAADPQAPCTLFAGRHVLATGWCSAHVRKAG